jgi:putative component of membrane protein insertase Oxa1/YidC/SpoIIIJ protein YidD
VHFHAIFFLYKDNWSIDSIDMRDATQLINRSSLYTKRSNKSWAFRKPLSLLDNSLRLIAISLIGGYQQHLSPRKGYSCAHRVVHGGYSCSEYVKNVLADKSLFETTLLAKRRFKECSIAYTFSKSQVAKYQGTVGFDGDICGLIVGIVTAIIALIFGRNSGCCK